MNVRRVERVWLWLSALASLSVGLGAALTPILLLAAFGVAIVIAVPELAVLGVAIGVEEQLGSAGATAASVPIIGLGSGFYRAQVGSLALFVALVLVATAISTIRRGVRWHHSRLALTGSGIGAVWTTVLAFHQGASARGAITAATPWFLLITAALIGANIVTSRRLSSATAVLVAVALVGKAVIAAGYASGIALGAGARLFYDSALPAIAVSAAAAVFVVGNPRRVRYVVTGVAAIVVSLVAFRRNVWLSGAVAIPLVLILSRSWSLSRRVVAGLVLVTLVAIIVAPRLVSETSYSAHNGLSTLRGNGTDRSVAGHLSDWHVGTDLLRGHTLLGIGVLAVQQPGLIDETSGRLYVHSELLQTALRLGVPGVIALIVVLFAAVRAGTEVFVRRMWLDQPIVAGAAMFLLMLPFTLLFFPHLTTTFRWPTLCGLAIGIAGAAKPVATRASPSGLLDAGRHSALTPSSTPRGLAP